MIDNLLIFNHRDIQDILIISKVLTRVIYIRIGAGVDNIRGRPTGLYYLRLIYRRDYIYIGNTGKPKGPSQPGRLRIQLGD